MYRRLIPLLAIMATLVLPNQAQAYVKCSGKVHALMVDTGGQFWIDYGYGWYVYCSIDAPTNYGPLSGQSAHTVTVETCKTSYATALTAQASGRNIVAYLPFDDACDMNNWAYASRYVMGLELDS